MASARQTASVDRGLSRTAGARVGAPADGARRGCSAPDRRFHAADPRAAARLQSNPRPSLARCDARAAQAVDRMAGPLCRRRGGRQGDLALARRRFQLDGKPSARSRPPILGRLQHRLGPGLSEISKTMRFQHVETDCVRNTRWRSVVAAHLLGSRPESTGSDLASGRCAEQPLPERAHSLDAGRRPPLVSDGGDRARGGRERQLPLLVLEPDALGGQALPGSTLATEGAGALPGVLGTIAGSDGSQTGRERLRRRPG
jgi:hypothetical protein